MTDRGVSDAIGFVLLFALVVGMVGLTYGAGVSELQEARNAERLHNAERAFGVLEENVEDTAVRNAPSRATSIDLAGGKIGSGEPVTFNLTLVGSGRSFSATTIPIVYQSQDTELVYVNGAVIRDGPSGAVFVERPPLLTEPLVVPYVLTDGHRGTTIGGETTALVRTRLVRRSTFLQATEEGPYQARLNVTTPRTDVWHDHVESTTGASCATTGETVSCSFTADQVYVSLVVVDVTLN